jgi:hypothetical protein
VQSSERLDCLITYYFLSKGLITSLKPDALDLQMFQWCCQSVANMEPAPEVVRRDGVTDQLERIATLRRASENSAIEASPRKRQKTTVHAPAEAGAIAQRGDAGQQAGDRQTGKRKASTIAEGTSETDGEFSFIATANFLTCY